jgi:glyoxylase-like metal-dependent hydrolase (beta-lactamase superfamily II)
LTALTIPVQLSENLYVVYSEYPHVDCGNVYLITGLVPTLIDCGSPRGVGQLVRNLGQLDLHVSDLEQVIVTHGDYDHIQGFHELFRLNPNLRLFLNTRDWPIVHEHNPYGNSSSIYDLPFILFREGMCLPLEDGQVLRAGNTDLTVHHTPGHTEGCVCLLGEIDATQVLFAGDTIGGAMKGLEGANIQIWTHALQRWRESLNHLATLEFDWVLNGHEPAGTLPLSRQHFDRMLKSFGAMLSPWFSLADDEPVMVANEAPRQIQQQLA